jgi:tetratricopeptide (TPR) repeat protein
VKTILATFLTFLLLLPVSAVGEIQAVTHTVKQSFGGSQSPDDARISAVAKAKREALEMAGTYIESLTVVKNSHVDKDEILALAAGVLKAEVVSQKNYASEDAFGIDVVVKVVVDTSVLEERVKKLLQDKTHLTQLKEAQKREKELLQKVAQLEAENWKLTAKKQSTQKLKKQFQQASRGLTAVDWVNQALALWDGTEFTDPGKAIEHLSNAINLQKDYAQAYLARGVVYRNLGQHQRAIEDYNEGIRLKPDNALAYINRGAAYKKLGQYHRAIEDLNDGIRLKPDYAPAYVNRGIAYSLLGQYHRAIEDFNEAIRLKSDDADVYTSRGAVYNLLGQRQRAIEDFNEAIRLKPDDAPAYVNRGDAYSALGQYQRAIEDFNEAISLKPDDVLAYITRGSVYQSLDQHQRAIEDFNEAIRLRPDLPLAYNNRGNMYFLQGKIILGCRDVQKACVLGNCKLLELAKSKGYCR